MTIISNSEKVEILREIGFATEEAQIFTQSITYRPDDFTDTGNSNKFVQLYWHKIRFCPATGWLIWNGQVWENEDLGIDMLVKEFVEAMYKEARKVFFESPRGTDEKDAENYVKHAKKAGDAPRIDALKKLARSAVQVKLIDLDSDPLTINTPSGIVDLYTGDITRHNASNLCTKITTVSPRDSGGYLWETFLEAITCSDKELALFLQMIAGAALIGKVYHEGLFIPVGNGRNGKSTFFNVLSAVLGSYAGSVDINVFTTTMQNKGPTLATLRGKRLIITGELEEGRRLSVETLKRIASTDPITAEEKYKAPETFIPSHTAILHTNHLPRVGSTDEGTWRRLYVIPFNAVFEGTQDIPNYAQYLFENAGGAILSWMIEGAKKFNANEHTLLPPACVTEATKKYRSAEDWMQNFLDDRCEIGVNYRVGSRALYNEYKACAENAREYVRRENEFTAELENRGFKKIKPQNKRVWEGLRLLTTTELYGQDRTSA